VSDDKCATCANNSNVSNTFFPPWCVKIKSRIHQEVLKCSTYENVKGDLK